MTTLVTNTMELTPPTTLARIGQGAVIPVAMVITLGLFVFMAYLVKSPENMTLVEKEVIPVDIASVREEAKPNVRQTNLPTPPTLTQPPVRQSLPNDPSESESVIVEAPPSPEIPSGGGLPTLTASERGATPLVRIAPSYPTEAARDGIEGWVRLTFSIDEKGDVFDVTVIDAEPKRTFNRAAIAALKKWRFQPKIVEGAATIQTGQSVQLDFSLEK